ncbi:MAG TPA: hypothetical protein VKT49_00825 [Bryobacteraceae bacterium]|nr:hypothetical protein [Bryobacteraceae bacterium]
MADSATLERLSLNEMIGQSTAIVRGKVAGSSTALRGTMIFTFYTIQVTEQFKGPAQNSVTIAVPGGTSNNRRQTFPGAPQLNTGDEFVFFLWTGKSGTTQIIGLTQGLFKLAAGESTGDPVATRTASSELMLERGTGKPVKDQTLVMNLSNLRAQIAGTLGTGAR